MSSFIRSLTETRAVEAAGAADAMVRDGRPAIEQRRPGVAAVGVQSGRAGEALAVGVDRGEDVVVVVGEHLLRSAAMVLVEWDGVGAEVKRECRCSLSLFCC